MFDAYDGAPATADGLYRVRATRVSAAFVKPGANFASYDAVLIDPVSVSYKRDPRPAPEPGPEQRFFALDDATSKRLKQIFQGSFERQLSKSDVFAIASEPGPGALRVSGRIVDLSATVPPLRGSENHIVLEAGEMKLILDVSDSETGAPLARVVDRREIRPQSASLLGGFEGDPVNTWGAVREVCANWARLLRMRIEDLHALPVPPLPDAAPEPRR